MDIHRANECRAISAPLAAIAERCGCALLAVRHLGKSRGGGHALNAGIGSIDFAAAARSVLLVGADPDEPGKRAVVQIKNNLAPHGEAVGYTLEGGQFYWTGASDLTAGRILAPATEDEERSSVAEAMDFLRTALSDGARDAKAIESGGETGGHQPGHTPQGQNAAEGALEQGGNARHSLPEMGVGIAGRRRCSNRPPKALKKIELSAFGQMAQIKMVTATT